MKVLEKIRVMTADDHALFREGVAAVINNQPDMVLVAEASNTQDAINLYRQHKPDVILMDLRIPDIGGINALITIRAEFADAHIIILTTFSGDVEIQRALESGALAYALKSMPPGELLQLIRQAHQGKRRIPTEVAAHLAEHYSDEALSNREIEVLQH